MSLVLGRGGEEVEGQLQDGWEEEESEGGKEEGSVAWESLERPFLPPLAARCPPPLHTMLGQAPDRS
ncbi:hypothetical protein E2C01_073946 [Portunus trituberculatus]|uniref:Uncharacterized protein n=1 Tax=Portunus trituberculatus TaxID=210409 RepID=A0A5B7IF09_PORTR|nr:hypothetical protein [Portunus trituberculatus]